MENRMNNESGSNNYEHLMEILRNYPGFENRSEAELQQLAESIRELALLLHELANLEQSSGE